MTVRCPNCGFKIGLDLTTDWGGWHLEPTARTLTVDGVVIWLTQLEFAVVDTLVSARGKVVTNDMLMSAMYEDKSSESAVKMIDVYLVHIRKKLREVGYPGAIVTSYGGLKHLNPVEKAKDAHERILSRRRVDKSGRSSAGEQNLPRTSGESARPDRPPPAHHDLPAGDGE